MDGPATTEVSQDETLRASSDYPKATYHAGQP